MSQLANNRHAFHKYSIEEKFEAGLVLEGWEVKSIRAGRVQLRDSYVVVTSGELFLLNCHISPLSSRNTHTEAEPMRSRKVLLHAREVSRLIGKVQQDGYTLIPLSLYLKRGKIKTEIGLAKGKKLYDKRRSLRDKEWKREQQRLMKKIRQ